MIFVDANIPMYIVGNDPRFQASARALLERAAARGERLVTSAEVLQEILHRYQAIERPEGIQPALDVVLGTVDEVFPIDQNDVLAARDVLLARRSLSARDALHVAVMYRQGATRILSLDAGFDQVPGIERLG